MNSLSKVSRSGSAKAAISGFELSQNGANVAGSRRRRTTALRATTFASSFCAIGCAAVRQRDSRVRHRCAEAQLRLQKRARKPPAVFVEALHDLRKGPPSLVDCTEQCVFDKFNQPEQRWFFARRRSSA